VKSLSLKVERKNDERKRVYKIVQLVVLTYKIVQTASKNNKIVIGKLDSLGKNCEIVFTTYRFIPRNL